MFVNKLALRRALLCWLRTLFPGRVLDAKHCETTTNARNHSIPKTPVTIEELAISPGSRQERYFPYKEEAGGSNPSTPTETACRHWGFPTSGCEFLPFGRRRSCGRASASRLMLSVPDQGRGRRFEPVNGHNGSLATAGLLRFRYSVRQRLGRA